MTNIVQIHHHGGPDVLRNEQTSVPAPGPGEVRLRQTFAGVNYIDVYHRTGLYPVPELPAVLGVEAAGIVDEVGPNVTARKGDRVAYAMQLGAYAEERLISADRLVHLPEQVSDATAAAMMLRGLTAHMLLHRVYPVRAGTTVLVHAAAGGLGQIVCQWAKHLGAKVIGTVGSPEKAEIARAAGVDHVVRYRDTDFVSAVLDITDGRGVDVAYDGIGGGNLIRTFDAVRIFGTVASVGQAAGPVPPFDVARLGPTRSLSLSRPSIRAYLAEPDTYQGAAAELIRLIGNGTLKAAIGTIYPLANAARAHAELEGRATIGSTLLGL